MNIEKQLEEALAKIKGLEGQVEEALAANSAHADEMAAKDQELAGAVEAHAVALAESATALETATAEADAAKIAADASIAQLTEASEKNIAAKVTAEAALKVAHEAMKNPALADAGARGEAVAANDGGVGAEGGAQAEDILAKLLTLKGREKSVFKAEHKDEIEAAQKAAREAKKGL